MKRILIKLSGEQFGGVSGAGLDTDVIESLARSIREAVEKHKCEIAIVVGGGNFIRGTELHKRANIIEETTGHYMGMLATIINSLAINDILLSQGQKSKLLNKFEINKIGESFNISKVLEYFKEGYVCVVSGGLATPFFTTDTAAVAIGLELGCDAVVKVTKVDGVYNKDPSKNPDAVKYNKLTFAEVFANEDIRVMDRAAMAMAYENNIKIMVTELKENLISNILSENFDGTVIY